MDDVIIVGAGPSGLSMTASLKHHSIPYTILEREDCFASLWKKYSHDHLHLHLPKQFCQLPHMPLPSSYPKYVSKDQFVNYLDAYAARFKISPKYRRSVELATYDGAKEKWIVVAKNERSSPNFRLTAETSNPLTSYHMLCSEDSSKNRGWIHNPFSIRSASILIFSLHKTMFSPISSTITVPQADTKIFLNSNC